MRFLLLIHITFLFFFACRQVATQEAPPADGPADLKTILPGRWETISVRVIIQSAGNPDSSYVFELTEDLLRQNQTAPILTIFQPDNRYQRRLRQPGDSSPTLRRGIWNAFSDTLLMIEPDATYRYLVSLNGNQAEFRTLIDWDGDGIEDDDYLEILRQTEK